MAFEIISEFEQAVAEFFGSPYAVAVDSCSNGLFLCLKYLKAAGTISIPKYTYISVPMQIHHAGCQVQFTDDDWVGKYQLNPYPIWDAAGQWRAGMYENGLQVISFQFKKPLPIGRGGMILTDDQHAYNWLRYARHDGRDLNKFYPADEPEIMGWHFYMTPEDAARGILLMDA
jgi:dTDP-4-amino-4,6-dideoxygalactose transaminase